VIGIACVTAGLTQQKPDTTNIYLPLGFALIAFSFGRIHFSQISLYRNNYGKVKFTFRDTFAAAFWLGLRGFRFSGGR
jgi:hypothetical protein